MQSDPSCTVILVEVYVSLYHLDSRISPSLIWILLQVVEEWEALRCLLRMMHIERMSVGRNTWMH